MNSTHQAEVVPVVLTPHPDADTLSVVKVWGYTVVVKTDHWRGKDRGVYITPDTLVPTGRDEFGFLADKAYEDGTYRVRAMRLRGVVSQGLLVPTDEPIGSDQYAALGCSRYEPNTLRSRKQQDKFVVGGEEAPAPALNTGPEKYDVDAWERYGEQVFEDGEPVWVQEKLDGSNCRVVYFDGEFHVKSRNRWLKRTPDFADVTEDALRSRGCPEDKIPGILQRVAQQRGRVNDFWRVLEETPGLFDWLRGHPGVTVYGEVYGTTNRIKYGPNLFAAFDMNEDGEWWEFEPAMRSLAVAGVPVAPYLSVGYSEAMVTDYRSGGTLVHHAPLGTIREGVVIRPAKNCYHYRIGRAILKAVNPDFHALKG